MSDSATEFGKGGFDQTALTTLRLGLILLIVYWSYLIVAPFIPLVLWGGIIAVAVYPLHQKLVARLGDRNKLSATLITILGLIILTAPVIILTESLVSSSMDLAASISEGSVHVPPPAEGVQEWPLVGERLYSSWLLASQNLSAALERFGPQLEALRHSLIATAGGAGAAFLQLFFSMIIAGFFLAAAEGSAARIKSLVHWLVGERGPLLIAMSEATVRSVARGILGVAIIESIVAAIGLVSAGVPAAGFWTFLILVLSIVQFPPLLVMVPMIFYVLSVAGPFGSTVFVVCTVLVIAIDTFLKPVLLGRTVDAPMLVILMGAIGGMMLVGIVGLFVGAVVVMVAWELLQFSLEGGDAPAVDPSPLPQEPEASTVQE
jgi:predicted PurR-regulated permease PerM